jgi:hypothetical protein
MTTTQKFYSADEIKEDAARRIEDSDESVTSYTYPVGLIWQGTDEEQTVTVDVTAEMATEYDPFEDRYVTTGGHARFEDMTTDPAQTFINGKHEDRGPQWMESAVRIAREWWTVGEMLRESGVTFDTAELAGDLFFYLENEEQAEQKVRKTVYDAWMTTVGQGLSDEHHPLPETIEEIRRLQ